MFWHSCWDNVGGELLHYHFKCSAHDSGERREPPRPHLIKQDWKLINTGVIRKRIWKTWGTLSAVTETLDSFLLLSQHPVPSLILPHSVVPAATVAAALFACLQRLSHNSQLLWPPSSPLSQSGLLTADSWRASINVNLNHSYSFPLLKMHSACGNHNHRRVFLPQERSLWTGPFLLH